MGGWQQRTTAAARPRRAGGHRLTSVHEPQSWGKRLAEDEGLVGAVQLHQVLDHGRPLGRRLLPAQALDDALAQCRIQVSLPVAAQACQLRSREGGRSHGLPVEREHLLEPALGDAARHDVVRGAVKRDSRAEATERPPALR